MIKNYLKVAWRNLIRNKVFSFINIFGLSLGMACSLLIMLWVLDERSVDNFHANGNNLYSVYERQYYDNKIDAFHSTPGIMYKEMKRVLPEVKFAAPFAWNDLSTFQVGDKIMKEEGNYSSEDFFKMFSYPILAGSAANALTSPVSIAISHKMADDFFGSPAAALGKTIRYQNKKDLQVTAVFENLPSIASDKFDYIINWETFLDRETWAKEWGNNGPRTYLQLKPGTDPVKLDAKIKKFLDNYNKDQGKSFHIELGLQRFGDMYLHSNFKEGKLEGGRIQYVKLFSVVAIFILAIACINFMNLTTARSVKRAREIGIRKVVGAVRYALIGQFIGEAVLLAFISLVFGLLIVSLLLPLFNNLTNKHIIFPASSPSFWLIILALSLASGFFSGIYPALFLSSFKPIRVLKGSLKFSPSTTLFRKGLVIFQFGLSMILIIGTIVVSKQVRYIQSKNLGYDRENLIYIPLEGDLPGKYTLFKQEAIRIPGVKLVSRISQSPTQIDNGTGGVDWEGKDPNVLPMFTQVSVGYDFVKTMNIGIVEGRDFSTDFATDSVGYILNEKALEKIGYKNPIGRPLTFWQKKGKIVGIIKDFHFNSFHEPIKPIIIRLAEHEEWGEALIRVEPGKTKQVLSGLEKISRDLNPKFPFTYKFSDEEYTKMYKNEQMVQKLSNYFALLAITISCLGLLGLAMFTAEQRTREMGIRKVLGATSSALFGLLSKDFLILVAIAFVIAAPLAWLTMNAWLQDYVYRISIEWWVFIVAGIAALLIALFTISFQTIKAAVANPINSLRSE
jgi:putative ABC transport system permease protein